METVNLPETPSKFSINELAIITKAGKLDISKLFQEINIFDSLLSPVMSGAVVIIDSIGLSSKLLFDGSEVLLVNIGKDTDSSSFRLKKAFRIYRQSNRATLQQNAETYTLEFVSDEFIFSEQQKINQSYKTTYSDVVNKILVNYLKVPEQKLRGVFQDTTGVRDLVIPNLKPLDALEWCAKRAVDQRRSPNYVFFENNLGFNFASLSYLLSSDYLFKIKFPAKNLEETKPNQDLLSPRHFEVVNQSDKIKTTREGVAAGTFIGFDPITRTVQNKRIGFEDHYNAMDHGNDTANFSQSKNRGGEKSTQAFDSKKVVNIFGANIKNSQYIKKYDPTSISKVETPEDYMFARKAIFANLMNKRIKLVMPGNFQLTSGFNLNVRVPDFSKKESGSENEDRSLSGKYLIIATRHIIKYDIHETVLELATTSNEIDFIPQGVPEQNKAVEEYGSY
jgi:hypothetical protein